VFAKVLPETIAVARNGDRISHGDDPFLGPIARGIVPCRVGARPA
jgi:hypothetical protein